MKKLLKKIWTGWKRIAHRIGRFQTRVIVAVAYLLILSPLGLIGRLVGWDPLEVNRKNRRKSTNWKEIRDGEPDLDSLRRQS
ncbi:MAG TPA: SxtJ family membrane protein [candidate division Zixibacteria bacterium]|nr:SxtJ family membrane protein [candidate division Zixibacteria bacterium]